MCGTKSCAILGHSPMRFAWGFDEEAGACRDMKLELAQQIMVLRQQGVTHFSVACDYGVGLYAAELINVLRDNDPELMLFCVTPYEEQATKWTPELRERYFDNGTFRNVPLLLSHACPCAGWFDAYGKPHIVLAVDGDKVHQPTPKDRVEFIHQVSLRQGFQKGFDGSPSGLFAADCLIQRFI